MAIVFKEVVYTSINALIDVVYKTIYLKLHGSIIFDSLLDIYHTTQSTYKKDMIYEEDIDFKNKWIVDSSDSIQLAKDALSYIFEFSEYKMAFDAYYEYIDNVNNQLLKNDILEKLKEMADLVYYHDADYTNMETDN